MLIDSLHDVVVAVSSRPHPRAAEVAVAVHVRPSQAPPARRAADAEHAVVPARVTATRTLPTSATDQDLRRRAASLDPVRQSAERSAHAGPAVHVPAADATATVTSAAPAFDARAARAYDAHAVEAELLRARATPLPSGHPSLASLRSTVAQQRARSVYSAKPPAPSAQHVRAVA